MFEKIRKLRGIMVSPFGHVRYQERPIPYFNRPSGKRWIVNDPCVRMQSIFMLVVLRPKATMSSTTFNRSRWLFRG